jgi:hypothetical protein
MKKVSITTLILLCVLFGSCDTIASRISTSNSGATRGGKLGPITLTVIDQQTGLPVSDITVYYDVVKYRPVLIMEVEYITIDVQKHKTDSNGKITIPAKEYKLSSSETLGSRAFFINVDTKNGKMPNLESRSNKDSLDLAGFIILGERGQDNNFKFANTAYTATAVNFFNYGERDERIDMCDDVLYYEIDAPFSENAMAFTAELPVAK